MTVGCEMDDQMTFPPIGVHGIPYDSPENTDSSVEALAAAMHSKAARGIRLLAKTRRENRDFNADACAIPHLRKLLRTKDSVLQYSIYPFMTR
ncbi:hypothetical protein NC652_000161 [Populus alba x Populus x berolinensis]|nr:hypothetical protein NC652_000161 [Populus alba x Populus x berolinensis]